MGATHLLAPVNHDLLRNRDPVEWDLHTQFPRLGPVRVWIEGWLRFTLLWSSKNYARTASQPEQLFFLVLLVSRSVYQFDLHVATFQVLLQVLNPEL